MTTTPPLLVEVVRKVFGPFGVVGIFVVGTFGVVVGVGLVVGVVGVGGCWSRG